MLDKKKINKNLRLRREILFCIFLLEKLVDSLIFHDCDLQDEIANCSSAYCLHSTTIVYYTNMYLAIRTNKES